MDKQLKKRAIEFSTLFEHAKESKNWDFVKNFDLKKLYDDLVAAYNKICRMDAYDMAQLEWERVVPYMAKTAKAMEIKKYIASEIRYKERYPDWFKVRGNKINDYLFSHIDKFSFRRKFFRPLKMEDFYIKWLVALQMLGCAVWRDITDFAQVWKSGMCSELDARESMVGAGWMEIVGEDKNRGKTRPIYSITEAGADVIQYCAEH